MKSDSAVSTLKIFDLVVFVVSFAVAAAPIGHAGLLAAFAGTAAASDMLPFAVPANGSITFQDLLATQVSIQGLLLTGLLLVAWYATFTALGMYSPERVGKNSPRSFVDFVAVVVVAASILGVAAVVIELPRKTIGTLLSAVVVASFVSVVARLVVNSVLSRARRTPKSPRQVIIVGTNARAIGIARTIEANPWRGLRLAGFVDQGWAGDEAFRRTGYKVVSDFAGFQEYLKDHVVDEVVICTPLKSLYDLSSRIFAQCQEQGITVRFRTDPVSPSIGRAFVDHLGGEPVLTVRATPTQRFGLFVKRAVDVAGSAVLLVLISPLMALIAVAIKLSSEGPVFFAQERVGLNKRRFRLYKFRTMVVDAEKRLAALESLNEVSGPVFKIKRDPRVTPLGRFLRKSSLDELPQLLNVLKGDMSLVGPRPLAVRDYNGITEDWQRRRLSVPPGITCLWQVRGRSSIPFDQWMVLDLEYIDNWSLLLDLKICLQTVPAVLLGRGAA